MNLHDWNKFLWHVVRSRLYRPGARIYLAFDDALLSEELKSRGSRIAEGSPTVALNTAIKQHCGVLASGCIGLRARADTPFKRNNWRWVLRPNEPGKSLALVFAAQQILAAEGMQGISFYESYWKALGATSYEVRRNPFGDIGRNSFSALWDRLRIELKETLSITDSQITFEPGKGSNKFRNFPVSQSLLSEGDLRAANKAIRKPDVLDDTRLLAALKKVKLTRSGKRKVYTRAIGKYLVSQFREFTATKAGETWNHREPHRRRATQRAELHQLSLYEEQEFFGESTYHCYIRGSTESARSMVAAALGQERFILFWEQDDEIRASVGSRLPSTCSQAFILGKKLDEQWLVERLERVSSSQPGGFSFFQVSISIGSEYLLISCPSVPEEIKGLCLETLEGPGEPSKRTSRGLAFRGGLCVNEVSKCFLIGFPPEEILANDVVLGMDHPCELDADPTTVGSVLGLLGSICTPSRYKLQVGCDASYFEIVGPREIERAPILARTNVCILPPMLAGEEVAGQNGAVTYVSNIETTIDEEWTRKRDNMLRQVTSALVRGDVRWVKVGTVDAQRCLALASYLTLPRKLINLIIHRIATVGIVPWPLYAQSSVDKPQS